MAALQGDRPLDNVNPTVYVKNRDREPNERELNDHLTDEIDAYEVFSHIRGIKDPEHPYTLEELNVVQEELIHVDNENNVVTVQFTPTVTGCSLVSLIGLTIQVKLLRSLPSRFKIDVKLSPGSHQTEEAVNKQLADKERVAAALENTHLLEVVNQCLVDSY